MFTRMRHQEPEEVRFLLAFSAESQVSLWICEGSSDDRCEGSSNVFCFSPLCTWCLSWAGHDVVWRGSLPPAVDLSLTVHPLTPREICLTEDVLPLTQ